MKGQKTGYQKKLPGAGKEMRILICTWGMHEGDEVRSKNIADIYSGNEEQSLEDNIPQKDDLAFWKKLLIAPWRLLFAFVPPYQIAHAWIAFLSSLAFIAGIAYVVTKFTDLISSIHPYTIALTALAAGTSWPDLVASKIAADNSRFCHS
ncbi:hypothetical protein SASPL_107232 [Salvia splendens]|uniref:Sodium/calcium exchanger membrane region domain-containing protein n=1 Tax=Salvia splendens TaxID=180675 RepID=A0A8X8YB02_SALSN|nr:hypothetical protein SASPL_107232 [Salvia splendens]